VSDLLREGAAVAGSAAPARFARPQLRAPSPPPSLPAR